MENRSHALMAGLFVIVLSVAAAAALWWFGQSRSGASYYLLETRKSVGGLNAEAVVRYRGIRAGKVDSIAIDPQNPTFILVKISLEDRFKLTKGTTAKIAAQGITGLSYIALDDDGKNPEPLVSAHGDYPRIALQPSMVDTLTDNVGDLMSQLQTFAKRMNTVLDEKNVANLNRTLENAATASDGLRQLRDVMTEVRAVLSPENTQRMNRILAQVEKTSGEAAPLAAEVRELVRNMNQLAQRGDALLSGGGGDASSATLPKANALMQELTHTSRQLSRLLETLDESPQALIFGKPAVKPGPGEAGFDAGQGGKK